MRLENLFRRPYIRTLPPIPFANGTPALFHEPALVILTRTFRSPRTFHPSYSLLGRALRRWTGDRLRGEALYLVIVSSLVLALLMVHYLGWALLQPMMTGPDATDWQIGFWIGQLVSLGVLAAVGIVGFRPPVTVRSSTDRLVLEQGSDRLSLSFDDVEEVRRISARRFHRHYRHYERTRLFTGRLASEVLLLVTPDGPVIVGLSSLEELGDLYSHLTEETPTLAETPATA